MISVFGSNITNAYTNGVSVKAIYTNGVKVWPVEPEVYYIRWWPSTATGSFTIDGRTYRMEDYSGYFELINPIITSSAFRYRDITSIMTNATTVEENAFLMCDYLESVNLPNCENIGLAAIGGCQALTSVNIPKCSYINDYAFMDCRNISEISIPECTHIGTSAFAFCYSLKSIVIENDCYIGMSAFCDCSLFESITLFTSGVRIEGWPYYPFSNTKITPSTGSIFVPSEYVDFYKSSYNWSYYSDRIYPIES